MSTDDPTQFSPLPVQGLTPTNYQRSTGGNLRWQPPTVEHLQKLLPQYEILSLLGRGGMGAVYKARQTTLDRIVAIKILPPEAVADDDANFVERFKNEARTMARLDHPAIVQVFDYGETAEQQLYFVMQFVDGTDVLKMISEQEKLPPDHALAIAAHVCDALQYAHAHGVIHRDIKPANVLLNMEGQVKVADFGLAKTAEAPGTAGLTKSNVSLGTPDYIAPEGLVLGVMVDHRADLYAVGVMLYHMLTGKVPRGMFDMPSLLDPKIDARFDAIIAKAMKQNREERYQDALEIRRDLDVILTTPPQQKSAPARQKPVMRGPGQSAGSQTPPPSSTSQTPPQGNTAISMAGTDASAPGKKSNARLIFGIIGAAVLAAGAFFLLGGKKPPSTNGDGTKLVVPPAKASSSFSDNEPGWINIWDTDDKARQGGIEWKDGALLINNGKKPKTVECRDAALRAAVKLNKASAGPPEISVRVSGIPRETESRLYLVLEPFERVLYLKTRMGGTKNKTLKNWDLPSSVKEGDWVPIELRAVDDQITVSASGRKLGTIQNTDVMGGGRFMLSGKDVQMREVAYLPLDKPAAPAPKTPPPVDKPVSMTGKDTAASSVPPASAPVIPSPSPPISASSPSAPPPPASPVLPPELATLDEQFKKLQAERVTAPFDADVAKLNTGYLGGLDRAIADEKKAGHLDDVLALEDEKKLIADKHPVPSLEDESTASKQPPDTLKKLRAIYRGSFAKLEQQRAASLKLLTDPLVVRLKTLESDFTKKDRIADAKVAKEYRQGLEPKSVDSSSPDAAPGPSASTSTAGAGNAPLSPKAAFTNSLGMKFVPVKDSKVLFCIHPTRLKDYAAFAAENPEAGSSWKSQKKDGIPVGESDDCPVVGVNWTDSQAFCAWLGRKEGKTYRLPTDREWSIAVGIGQMEKVTKDTTPESLSGKIKGVFPWGTQWPPPKGAGNYSDTSCKEKFPTQEIIAGYTDGFPTTSPVMSFKPNKQGLYDMSGNVWQWCEDWYDAAQKDRVQRGGSWRDSEPRQLLSSSRRHDGPDHHDYGTGFRCVLQVAEQK